MEIWHSLQPLGYNKYSVSSEGRIRNDERGTILKGTESDGYVRVKLSCDGITSNFMVHRLVLLLFFGPPLDDTYTVDHLNRIRNDNRLCNLKWSSPSEQSINRNTVKGGRKRSVIQLKDDTIVYTWDMITDAANYYDITGSTISRACRKGNIFIGYKWKYVDQINITGEEWKDVQLSNEKLFRVSSFRACRTTKR